MDLGIGESGRLEHIKETLENQKDLYVSDKKYLEKLIGNYLDEKTENNSESKIRKSQKISNIYQSTKQDVRTFQNKTFTKFNSLIMGIFNSENKLFSNLGRFLGRLGLAFVFTWAGMGKLSGSISLEEMIVNMTGMNSIFVHNSIIAIGYIEIIGGFFIIIGFLTRLASLVQSIILIGGGLLFSLDFTSEYAIWKDVGLLALSLFFFLSGAGRWSIDYLISRRFKRSKFKKEIENLKHFQNPIT